jgi:hypothetical protein
MLAGWLVDITVAVLFSRLRKTGPWSEGASVDSGLGHLISGRAVPWVGEGSVDSGLGHLDSGLGHLISGTAAPWVGEALVDSGLGHFRSIRC